MKRGNFRAILIVIWGLLLAGGGLAQAQQQTVQAQKFELVDSQGKVRAALTTVESDNPALVFYDNNGKIRLLLRLREIEGYPFLALGDNNEKPLAYLKINPEGSGLLALLDRDNKVIWTSETESSSPPPAAPTQTPAQAVPSARQNSGSVLAWIAANPDENRTTISWWKGLNPRERVALAAGMLSGIRTAVALAGGETADFATQQKRAFLLEGWSADPGQNYSLMDTLLNGPGASRTLAAAYVRVEAGYAKAAGETTRAARLLQEAKTVELATLPTTTGGEGLYVADTGRQLDQILSTNGHSFDYRKGFLDGIALTRARIAAGTGARGVKGITPTQMQTRLDALCPAGESYESLFPLMLAAQDSLLAGR
jgi:hypothetical protein